MIYTGRYTFEVITPLGPRSNVLTVNADSGLLDRSPMEDFSLVGNKLHFKAQAGPVKWVWDIVIADDGTFTGNGTVETGSDPSTVSGHKDDSLELPPENAGGPGGPPPEGMPPMGGPGGPPPQGGMPPMGGPGGPPPQK